MKRIAVAIAVFALSACGGGQQTPGASAVSKEPVSVRGWVSDVEGSKHATNPDMEIGRLTQLYQATQIWVEKADYVSGGVAENGSFILLDVPPGDVTIGFSAPGVERAYVVMKNIPGNSDVFLPAVILKNNAAAFVKPQDLKVRVPARIDAPKPTGKMATIAGVQVPIVDTPIAAMVDRHDYPQPGGFRPLATVR